MKAPTLHCAIYTRKSSEEGLEQDFNSLHAQREACEAYIKSQQNEGWKLLPMAYDDGGYSGGTTQRPALQRLLADIVPKRIQIVVVYKVDRLTRSLADFAKIVEHFDAQGVSFVSVTQQFNTTTSMGRLTLNVLLSFAQFEREVTGERIRDKIHASKQKGLWMGGIPPVGYQCLDRKLVVAPEEAEVVRLIFQRYLQLGCIRKLKLSLDEDQVYTPQRVCQSGRAYGGRCFSRGQLYRLLTHPIYLGQIKHRENIYPGRHPAIIETALWENVQQRLTRNRQNHRQRRNAPSDSFLAGKIVDAEGRRLVPSHGQKQAKRYRYYLSESLVTGVRRQAPAGLRLPAHELEQVVVETVLDWLENQQKVLDEVSIPPEHIERTLAHLQETAQALTDPQHQGRVLQALIQVITVQSESVHIRLNRQALYPHPMDQAPRSDAPSLILETPIQLKRCGLKMRLIVGGNVKQSHHRDARLIQLIGKALDWRDRLISGKATGVAEIARTEGVTGPYVTRMLYLSCLAPDIVTAILEGRHPPELTSDKIKQYLPLPMEWDAQRRLLGFKTQ